MDWSKMVKMTVPVGLCGWQQRGSLTINGRTTEFPVGVEMELPEPVAERVKALMADAEEKAEHVQPLKPWMQYVTGADGVARWEPRLAYADTEEVVILPETTLFPEEDATFAFRLAEPLATSLHLGMICAVIYNGVEYECPVKTKNLEGIEVMFLGNAGSSDEPFAFVQFPPEIAQELGYYAQLDSYDGAESVTLSIKGVVEQVKTIDPKFLPDDAGRSCIYVETPDWTLVSGIEVRAYKDAGLTTPLDYATGTAMLKAGALIAYNMDGVMYYNAPIVFSNQPDGRKSETLIYSMGKMSISGVTLKYSE